MRSGRFFFTFQLFFFSFPSSGFPLRRCFSLLFFSLVLERLRGRVREERLVLVFCRVRVDELYVCKICVVP
ncbi:hypothetical protein HD806DRAFT_473571 [Xylariaceae sp. AK1471]|nr:hypothetical protein HD806DRAFT_473571 [Xylariaceae sp. AK1471]